MKSTKIAVLLLLLASFALITINLIFCDWSAFFVSLALMFSCITSLNLLKIIALKDKYIEKLEIKNEIA